jgi:hypothetical protein
MSFDYQSRFSVEYVMTTVAPPGATYSIVVPPGIYGIVARLDSDPLSAAGYITCHSPDCIPLLQWVRVNASQGVTHVDIADWGSPYARSELWNLDRFGVALPIPSGAAPSGPASPSASPPPSRLLPDPSTLRLPAEHDIPSTYQSTVVGIRLHLPDSWYAIQDPAGSIDPGFVHDFANQNASSPLSLDSNGAWLTVEEDPGRCPTLDVSRATNAAQFVTGTGAATFYFLDPAGPTGPQPFMGYRFAGTTAEFPRGCITFLFNAVSQQVREANLATFEAIVKQAQFVDPY